MSLSLSMQFKIFLIVLLTNISFVSGQNFKNNTFIDLENNITELENSERYEEAISLIENVKDRFPEKEFELIKELTYLYDKVGKYEMNLKLWKYGHTKGYFFLLNERVINYNSYMKLSDFDSIIIKNAVIREAALKKSKLIYKVIKPDNFRDQDHYPLFFILHGGGSNLEKVMNRWKPLPGKEYNFITVFLQSYLNYDSKNFGWRSSDKRIYNDIRNCFSEITEVYNIDTSLIVIGGTSAGGTMAIDIAFNNIIPVSGIIGFCPGKPRDFKLSKTNKKIKIYMLGGEHDFYLEMQKEMAELFNQVGLFYKHIIVPGMGHEFPATYQENIKEALNYICMRKSYKN